MDQCTPVTSAHRYYCLIIVPYDVLKELDPWSICALIRFWAFGSHSMPKRRSACSPRIHTLPDRYHSFVILWCPNPSNAWSCSIVKSSFWSEQHSPPQRALILCPPSQVSPASRVFHLTLPVSTQMNLLYASSGPKSDIVFDFSIHGFHTTTSGNISYAHFGVSFAPLRQNEEVR